MFRSLFVLALLFLVSLSAKAAPETPRLVVPSSHGEAVTSIAVTPDGRWTLSSTAKGQLKLWETSSNSEVRSSSVGKLGAETLVGLYPRNDTQFYTVCTRNIFILEVPSLTIVNTLKCREDISSATVSADGEKLWLGGFTKEKSYLRLLQRGRFPIRTVMDRPHSAGNQGWGAPNISPDGRFALIQEARNGPTMVVRLEDASLVHTLPLADKRADGRNDFSIAWASDGRIIYSQAKGPEGKVNQIDFIGTDTFQVEWSTQIPIKVPYVSFRPKARGKPGDPDFFTTVESVLFIENAKLDGPYQTSEYHVLSAAFVGNGRSVLCGTTEGGGLKTRTFQVRKFDRARGRFSDTWSPPRYQPALIAGSSSGDTLFVSDGREDAKLIQMGQGGLRITHVAVDRCFDASFHPKAGQVIYSYGNHDKRFSGILDVGDPNRPRLSKMPFESMARGVFGSLVLSPTGKLAADIRAGITPVQIYDPYTGKVSRELPNGHYAYPRTSGSGAFSADDRLFVYFASHQPAQGGRSVNCYDLATGQLRWTRQRFDRDFAAFQFSADGKEVYALGIHWFPKLFVFDAQSGQTLRESILPHCELSAQAVFSPTGALLAMPDGKSVILVEVATGAEIKRMTDEYQAAERVAFVGENRIASSGADNAIRLWDVPSATLLGTVTFSKDGQQWAFIHPSGRFEATEGFQEQMYFMQGTTKVPLAAYFESYYTPGLLSQILAGQAIEAPGIELKDLAQPPKVFIELAGSTRNLTVEDAPQTVASEQATLRISAQSPDTKIAEIRLYHNGKLIESRTRNLTVEDDVEDVDLEKNRKRESIAVTLLPGENSFRAIALNEQRTESKAAELVLEYQAPQEVAAGRTGGGVQLHLLVVGLNTYKNPKYNLNYAVPDATAVRAALERSATGIFSKINVTALYDDKATRAALVAAFAAIAQASGPRDVFVFYYAGHGVMSGDAKPEFFLAPHELTQLYGADEQLRAKAISSAELLAFSQKISAQKQLFILDACQSAGALAAVAMRGAAEEKAVAQLARASGTHWLTASGSEQFATEFEKLGHGTFTYALLEALQGKADTGDGRVTVNEVKAWVETQVPDLTRIHKGTPQYPASYGFGQDFPLGIAVK